MQRMRSSAVVGTRKGRAVELPRSRPWISPSRAFQEQPDDRAGQDELDVGAKTAGAVPAAAAVKELASVRTHSREDLLEIGSGG
jgi:hypothetical protein